MLIFGLLTALTLASASFVMMAMLGMPRRHATWRAGVILLVASPVFSLWHAARLPAPPSDRPLNKTTNGHVTSRNCRACHPRQHASWHASFHRTMTQLPDARSVLADFDAGDLQVAGHDYALKREDDEFWIEMQTNHDDEVSGEPRRVWRQAVLITGSHHYQVYWHATGDGRRIASFPIVYLVEEERWIPRWSAFVLPPEWKAGEYEEASAADWNTVCIKCHVTNGRPGYERQSRSWQTEVGEFGIACEACHGPAERHAEVYRDPFSRYAAYSDDQPAAAIINPARLSHTLASQTCGQCHSVNVLRDDDQHREWLTHGYAYRPGADLKDTRLIVSLGSEDVAAIQRVRLRDPLLLQGSFWADGMVRVAGREYNGLTESACYLRGELSCFSCHAMHQAPDDSRPTVQWADDQLKPAAAGDGVCLRCHESIGHDMAAHTSHAPRSSGSRCTNCHMPHTTFGLLRGIRSHQIDSPNVDVTLRSGRPNACNLCHLDKTLAWTAEHLSRWYDIASGELNEDHHTTAASVLWLLRGDAAQRAIVAWNLGWPPAQRASGTDWMPVILGQLLDDPYDAVRFVAHRTLRTLPGFEDFEYDFVGPFAHRTEAPNRVLESWDTLRRPSPVGRDQVLIDINGDFMRERMLRILSDRDDTPVYLTE